MDDELGDIVINEDKRLQSPGRREFLMAIMGAVLTPSLIEAAQSRRRQTQKTQQKPRPRPKRYDVSYVWAPNLNTVLDYQEEVEKVLAPIAKQLRIVRSKENFGLIYNRNGTHEQAAKTARGHTEILKNHDLDAASPIEDSGYFDLYNVRYGALERTERAQRKNYDVVANFLGPQVAKDLVIEKVDGRFALVYRRRGTLESTKQVAAKHSRDLAKANIKAAYIRENNNDVAYQASSDTEGEIEKKPDDVAIPEKPKPEPKAPAIPSTPRTFGTGLESVLRNQLGDEAAGGRIGGDENYSFVIADNVTGEELAAINADVPRQSASMVKPFVALGIMHLVSEKKLTYNRKVRKDMEMMIQKSNNKSTNRLMTLCGGPMKLDALLKTHYSDIFQDTAIVETIPNAGKTYLNKASARDYSRFLHRLVNNNLPGYQEIRRLMALPNRDRIFTDVPNIPNGTVVVDKTGTTAMLCGDMGVLYALGKDGKRYPYTIVGIIEKDKRAGNLSAWKDARGNVIRRVSGTVYEFMQNRYNLK